MNCNCLLSSFKKIYVADPRAKNNHNKGIFDKAVEDDNEDFVEYLWKNGYCDDPSFTFTPITGIAEGGEDTEEWWENANGEEEGQEGEGEDSMDAAEDN